MRKIKMEFTQEQIEKARACKTIDEFKDLAKAEGLSLTDEQAEKYYNVTHSDELTDEDLSTISGGSKGGEWVLIDEHTHHPKCPFCGASFDFVFRLYENNKSGQRKYEMSPMKCTCGAKIDYDCFTKNFIFWKNGEARRY